MIKYLIKPIGMYTNYLHNFLLFLNIPSCWWQDNLPGRILMKEGTVHFSTFTHCLLSPLGKRLISIQVVWFLDLYIDD